MNTDNVIKAETLGLKVIQKEEMWPVKIKQIIQGSGNGMYNSNVNWFEYC